MIDILHSILGPDLKVAGFIILNLIIIESLLSVDNAAVLATMVMDLPKEQRNKALKYGIIGAYVFRGLCLLFAAWLIKITWLKGIGGAYLLWLFLSFAYKKLRNTGGEEESVNKSENKIYKATVGMLGVFWSTVALVEIMDLAFSIDNVFAAVAYVENYPQPQGLYLVWIGVFIGILAMRFVAQGFVRLMEKFPFLEWIAFIVIGVLGLKLIGSYVCDSFKDSPFCRFLNGHDADLYVSIFTIAIFAIPVITSILFNFPRKKALEDPKVENVDGGQ